MSDVVRLSELRLRRDGEELVLRIPDGISFEEHRIPADLAVPWFEQGLKLAREAAAFARAARNAARAERRR